MKNKQTNKRKTNGAEQCMWAGAAVAAGERGSGYGDGGSTGLRDTGTFGF